MRKIDLYISGKKVDLDDNSFILFNYTFEDLNNPTIIKNSFSKQITLKASPVNNQIFGHSYKVDRITQYDDNIRGNFNPMQRTPFIIYDEKQSIIESGYCKLDKININNGLIEYVISLYGNLGLFFYNLKSKEDGTLKTLADLIYTNSQSELENVSDILVEDGANTVLECWNYLENPEQFPDGYQGVGRWANILSFAPCYNGIPSQGFDADRTLNDTYNNIPKRRVIDGVEYVGKTGANNVMTIFSNPHSEWELKELRWYLQRPVVSIRAIFEAICLPFNNGGFEVELDEAFFNSENHIYWDGWITLPMINIDNRNDQDILVKALKSSLTPVDYLISFAKMTGLVFLIDKALNKVTITTRANFFAMENGVIDLTERIDSKSFSLIPHLSDSRIYQFGNENIGEFAKDYKERYGKDYGIQRVNTGNEFSEDIKVVTESIQFKEAITLTERSLMYYSDGLRTGTAVAKSFRLPLFESVKTQLWHNDSNTMQEIDVLFENPEEYRIYPDNSSYPNDDWLKKVQLHDADNKVIEGANVLLIYNGMKRVPIYFFKGGSPYYGSYSLTKDNSDMDLLNEGKPCWGGDIVATLTHLPSFQRFFSKDGYVREICSWGMSNENSPGESIAGSKITLYDRFWKSYQTDRYDDDAMVMNCKVNLRGLEVGQLLLGRFFYFQGSIFVLNKITNHSITTDDLTDCEFIKVKDMDNYTNY